MEKTISIIHVMNTLKWHLSQLLVSPIKGHGMGPSLCDGDGLLDPSSDPVVPLYGKIDTIPTNGMVGLWHMVCER